MTSFTKDHTLVHEDKNIVHGDLTGVGLVSTYDMAEFNELLTVQCFG
jgi:hypothetical protein